MGSNTGQGSIRPREGGGGEKQEDRWAKHVPGEFEEEEEGGGKSSHFEEMCG